MVGNLRDHADIGVIPFRRARISGWYPSTAYAFRTQRFTRNTNRGMRNGSDIRPADIHSNATLQRRDEELA